MPRIRRSPPAAEFESLAFGIEPRPGEQPRNAARRAVRAAFPRQRWRLIPLAANDRELLAKPSGRRRLTPAQAWDHAYRLGEQPQVTYAEPLFTILDRQQQPRPGVRRASSAGTGDDPRTEGRFEWSIQNMRVPAAWALFGGATPGSAVRVGHPDTGYTRHPEIDGPRLRTDLGHDFEDNDADARDPLVTGLLRNPGHGTGTSSVIMSGEGQQAGSTGPAFVSGTAPGAALVPIRTTKSVVLWSMERLVRAVDYAVAHDCHVISMSLGGVVPSTALHNAVKTAEREGVIVLAAAGNEVGFVVFPAAFDEVIAVAASDFGDQPWTGSSRGPAVDITAPGHSIYRAVTTSSDAGERHAVERGSGTSFAVAGTAGVAALWLSYHGRSNLIAQYGKARLAAVFKQLLQQRCRTPQDWDTSNFGPGIVHAERLLTATLPLAAPARGMLGLQRRPVSIDDLPLEAIVHMLAPAPRSGVERALADLLDVDEDQLAAELQRVGAELAFRIGSDEALRSRLVAAASARRAQAVGGRRRSPTASAARRSLSRSSSRRLRNTLGAR